MDALLLCGALNQNRTDDLILTMDNVKGYTTTDFSYFASH